MEKKIFFFCSLINCLSGFGESSPILLSARLETTYRSGYTLDQGFGLPGFRVSLSGVGGKYLHYHASVGQTREEATILLPQLLPVEAYLKLLSQPASLPKRGSHLGIGTEVRLGMFRPMLHPLWTPDLADLPFGSYANIYSELYLGSDLGLQLSHVFSEKGFEVAAGVFNGTSVFGLNTNNAKAFTGYMRGYLYSEDGFDLSIGSSSYLVLQSSYPRINYKKDWVGSLFVMVESSGWVLDVDAFVGVFLRRDQSDFPLGGSVNLAIPISERWKWLSRYEYLEEPPSDSTKLFRSIQTGLSYQPETALKLFLHYTHSREGALENVDGVEFRARLLL